MIRDVKRMLKRRIHRRNAPSLWSREPHSRTFGLDRGMPIDRWYIEGFLEQRRSSIRGRVLEVGNSEYSKKFGRNVDAYEILAPTPDIAQATIIGDLCNPSSLPEEAVDCFICTQTFHVIFDVQNAIRGAYRILKSGGSLLATVPTISQISRYDMDRWGDYWRFTDKAVRRLFGDVFGDENVSVSTFGNLLSAVSFLHGLAAEELTHEELADRDPDYQLLVAIEAVKPGGAA